MHFDNALYTFPNCASLKPWLGCRKPIGACRHCDRNDGKTSGEAKPTDEAHEFILLHTHLSPNEKKISHGRVSWQELGGFLATGSLPSANGYDHDVPGGD